ERIVDRVPALDADQRGDLAVLAGAIDVIHRQGEHERVRVMPDHAVDDVDLFERGFDGGAGLHRRGRHVDTPELGADAARPQAGDVGLQARLRFGDIDRLEAEVALAPQLPRQVVVAVDDDGRSVNAAGL